MGGKREAEKLFCKEKSQHWNQQVLDCVPIKHWLTSKRALIEVQLRLNWSPIGHTFLYHIHNILTEWQLHHIHRTPFTPCFHSSSDHELCKENHSSRLWIQDCTGNNHPNSTNTRHNRLHNKDIHLTKSPHQASPVCHIHSPFLTVWTMLMVLPSNAYIGNRIEAYTPVWYDCPKSDYLTKRDKAQDKMQKRQINTMSTRNHVFPHSTNNLFPYPPMFVNYFHAVQNQYMVFWLWKDAQLACNRCPFEV